MASSIDIFSVYRNTIKADEILRDISYSNAAKENVPGAIKMKGILAEAGPVHVPTSRGIVSFNSTIEVAAILPCIDQYVESDVNNSFTKVGYYESLLDSSKPVREIADGQDSAAVTYEINQFFNACFGLVDKPGSIEARRNVVSAGIRVAERINTAGQAYVDLSSTLDRKFKDEIDEINKLGTRLGKINDDLKISENEAVANLIAEQNGLLRQLSTYGNLSTIKIEGGGLAINIGNFTLVDYSGSYTLPNTYNASTQTIVNGGLSYTIGSGKIAGILQGINFNNTAKTNLDTLSDTFRDQVNTLHASGTNALGNTNVKFFDDSANGALNLKVSAAVLADPKAVVTSAIIDPGDTIPDNDRKDIIVQIAQLRDQKFTVLGNQTFIDFHDNSSANLLSVCEDADNQLKTSNNVLQSNLRRSEQISRASSNDDMMEFYRAINHMTIMTNFFKGAMESEEKVMNMVRRN